MAIRLVQWTTGNVGKESVKAIVANPTLELVGCFAWSPARWASTSASWSASRSSVSPRPTTSRRCSR